MSKSKNNKSQKRKAKNKAKRKQGQSARVLKKIFASREDALDKSIVAFQQGDLERALKISKSAFSQFPENSVFLNNAGIFSEQLGNRKDAELYFRETLKITPNNADCLNNLGNLLRENRCFEESETLLFRAVELQPNDCEIFNNLGNLYKDQKKNIDAEIYYKRALNLDNEYPDARFNFSLLYLSMGKYDEGWLLYESRYHERKSHRQAVPPVTNKPRWKGESLSGRSLIIWAEQGFGDSFQFVRYLSLLKEQGLAKLVLVCRPGLKRLLSCMPDIDNIIEFDDWNEEKTQDADYWCFMMSLALHHETTLETIPNDIPYIKPTKDDFLQWAVHIPREDFRVGLIWKGNPEHVSDASRSLPSLKLLEPLWQVQCVSFISLQKGEGEKEAENPLINQPLVHIGKQLDDFANTASVVNDLDLVISVDTAMVHLAGALGTPCWVLLSDCEVDWRWGQEGNDSLWYPDVMRLFRQEADGDWESVIIRVAHALKDFVQENK